MEAILLAAIAGLLIGSFLNVVASRVPVGRSLLRPRSTCPSCGHLIATRDLVPLWSWIVLHGRCRDCGAPIPVRYVVVEGFTALTFAAVASRLGTTPALVPVLIATAGTIALATIDLERQLLPRVVVWPTTAAVALGFLLVAAGTGEWAELVRGTACALAWSALFAGIYACSPRLLGFGDVRFAPMLGLVLGWFGINVALLGFLLANLSGALAGGVLIASRRASRETPLPYGLFLGLGLIGGILLAAAP